MTKKKQEYEAPAIRTMRLAPATFAGNYTIELQNGTVAMPLRHDVRRIQTR